MSPTQKLYLFFFIFFLKLGLVIISTFSSQSKPLTATRRVTVCLCFYLIQVTAADWLRFEKKRRI